MHCAVDCRGVFSRSQVGLADRRYVGYDGAAQSGSPRRSAFLRITFPTHLPPSSGQNPLNRICGTGVILDGKAGTAVQAMPIGVLGCGMVSDMYLPNLVRSPMIKLVAVADVRDDLAATTADRYGVGKAVSPDDLLADPAIELVVNLTPIGQHVATTSAALRAGKHVYSEKVLAGTYEEACALTAEAQRRGLALACAPDTLLGTGFATGRRALDDGMIGAPLSGSAVMLRNRLDNPSWYTDGPMPFLDMAPYYVAALVQLLGPARKVTAFTRTGTAHQLPTAEGLGSSVALGGAIEFADGAYATVHWEWGARTVPGEVTRLDVFGSDGVINFPNPNNFGDPAYLRPYDQPTSTELPGSAQPAVWRPNLRGLGVAEFADAIHHDRRPRAHADLACHVVEIITALDRAGATGHHVAIDSSCTIPEPMDDTLRHTLIGV